MLLLALIRNIAHLSCAVVGLAPNRKRPTLLSAGRLFAKVCLLLDRGFCCKRGVDFDAGAHRAANRDANQVFALRGLRLCFENGIDCRDEVLK